MNIKLKIIIGTIIFSKITANVRPLYTVTNFGTDYFMLKIKNFAERELTTKFAIA